MMKIPQTSPGLSYLHYKEEIDRKVASVLESGWYILGKEVESFEKSFGQYCSVEECVSCGNGTDAIELGLRGLGIENSLVATVANTAVATVAGILRAGNRVCFADIDPETLTMSPESLEQLFAGGLEIKAVVAVHLFGQTADMDRIRAVAERYGAIVIEDCAQAHGAQYKGKKAGSIGEVGCFSFYPTKNLGCLGDGGCVVTSDPELARRLRALRQYGWEKRFISQYTGINSRLDELQAGILSVKLKNLDRDNQKRIRIAALYREALTQAGDLVLPFVPEENDHVYHQFVIRSRSRDALKEFLASCGVATAVHYPVPIHRQEAYCTLQNPVPLPWTEKVNEEILSLPMYPELTDTEVCYITDSIREFFG